MTKTSNKFPSFNQTMSTFKFITNKNLSNPNNVINVQYIKDSKNESDINKIEEKNILENKNLNEEEILNIDDDNDNESIKSFVTYKSHISNLSKMSTMSKSKLIDIKERVKLLLSRNKNYNQ